MLSKASPHIAHSSWWLVIWAHDLDKFKQRVGLGTVCLLPQEVIGIDADIKSNVFAVQVRLLETLEPHAWRVGGGALERHQHGVKHDANLEEALLRASVAWRERCVYRVTRYAVL